MAGHGAPSASGSGSSDMAGTSSAQQQTTSSASLLEPCCHKPEAGQSQDARTTSPWRLALQQRAQFEFEMRCPRGVGCPKPVCPMLYGFPSGQLVQAMKKGWLVLEGDYLLEDQPLWLCTSCNFRWNRYFVN